jgi:D-3-phosphoglycerate dehydrogenase
MPIVFPLSPPPLQNNINISFMSVSRVAKGTQAIMAIGVDEAPSAEVVKTIAGVKGVQEVTIFSEKRAA